MLDLLHGTVFHAIFVKLVTLFFSSTASKLNCFVEHMSLVLVSTPRWLSKEGMSAAHDQNLHKQGSSQSMGGERWVMRQVMHVDLHWLDVPERVKCKLVTMVYNCLHGKAPSYLTDCCTPISDVASSAFCQSSSSTRPRHNLSTYGGWAFLCRGSSCLELPVRQTAWTVVNCEQFQTVT